MRSRLALVSPSAFCCRMVTLDKIISTCSEENVCSPKSSLVEIFCDFPYERIEVAEISRARALAQVVSGRHHVEVFKSTTKKSKFE